MQKTTVVEAYRKAIESLYTGKCSVTVRETAKDQVTKVSGLKEVTKFEDIPCRLSFSSGKNTDEEFTTSSESTFTLFVAPEIDIPLNSKIKVTQNNYEFNIQNTKLKSYASHNEYLCVEFTRWA
ncbi:hypothetical protein HMPREF9225_1645 [Peptoniphilus duerdenii ATCC BAA-1640]|uniref:Phage head-tail adaptor n=1 Tax=Peptoniphilus duerdenii ATCC BAA-1640 TaxID=862517 RepID=E0NNA6_9FIRM|nr:hypothetical protein [Peptoniphilus duerdenii]EFM24779.1 hypothetical protein HMPREF9225_1645 [Peptoniphilus duerdenii ATCC BAA-1640]